MFCWSLVWLCKVGTLSFHPCLGQQHAGYVAPSLSSELAKLISRGEAKPPQAFRGRLLGKRQGHLLARPDHHPARCRQ